MSVQQSTATAPSLPASALVPPVRSTQGPALAKPIEKDTAARPSTVAMWGMVAVLSGICVGLGGALWAIELDVPYPLAIMAGYCAFIASACLCTALMMLNKPPAKIEQFVSSPAVPATSTTATTTTTKPRKLPNYAAWKLVSKYSVSDASRLWCDIEPGCPATQESIAWAHALLDAVKRAELTIVPRSGLSETMRGPEQTNPSWHTEIARETLKSWAQTHGHSPRFLEK
jgi:hypothetical protein